MPLKNQYTSHHTILENVRERVTAIEQLNAAIAESGTYEYAEIWVDHNNFPSLCGLIHADRGWLMLIRYDGDAGYSSRGSDDGARAATDLDFILSNGQQDWYPLTWTLPVKQVFNALQIFAETGQVPESIDWHNDAADNATGPNDTRFYDHL